MDSYSTVLNNILSNPFGAQSFLIHYHTSLQISEDKSQISFSESRRLVRVNDTDFIYGSGENHFAFAVPKGTTHIFYDLTGEHDVLTLPLMLKIDGDSFSVFFEDAWIKFSYPLSLTAIDQQTLYVL